MFAISMLCDLFQ